MSLEGQFKALEGKNSVDDELARMKGQVSHDSVFHLGGGGGGGGVGRGV